MMSHPANRQNQVLIRLGQALALETSLKALIITQPQPLEAETFETALNNSIRGTRRANLSLLALTRWLIRRPWPPPNPRTSLPLTEDS